MHVPASGLFRILSLSTPETRPGEQMQIDFGERRIEIGGVPTRVSLFVAALG
ncbi:hypothetical protein SAMN02799636_05982 [Methylobacterium sp. 275MFSha3.1]|uniref:hypothetical protein n=1 Tax=Methylobacterium sp. 275MFSha3.1 TaxID=1502746 RepID=UPI0008A74ED9|nr:hypothetical protein [Methylobacterium sp. 275MFSha3.1]SEI14809.1 hypothetical protein SAMN02799636_05982 [Methylobacterium sp. 275MFSha3.1]